MRYYIRKIGLCAVLLLGTFLLVACPNESLGDGGNTMDLSSNSESGDAKGKNPDPQSNNNDNASDDVNFNLQTKSAFFTAASTGNIPDIHKIIIDAIKNIKEEGYTDSEEFTNRLDDIVAEVLASDDYPTYEIDDNLKDRTVEQIFEEQLEKVLIELLESGALNVETPWGRIGE